MLAKLVGKLAEDKYDRVIADYVESYIKRFSVPEFEKSPAGKKILGLDPARQVAVLCRVFESLGVALRRMTVASEGAWADANNWRHGLELLAQELLKRNPPLKSDDLIRLCNSMMDPRTAWPDDWPVPPVVAAIQKYSEDYEMPDSLQKTLRRLIGFLNTGDRAETRNLVTKIAAVLGEREGAGFALIGSPWGKRVERFVNARSEEERRAWLAIFRQAAELQQKIKPSAKWFREAGNPVSDVGRDSFAAAFGEWFGPSDTDSIYREPNTNLIRGVIWIASQVEDDRLPSALGRFCEVCYKKVPGVGPANIAAGNACIYALGEMATERAVAELVRLKSRIKFNQGRKKLDEALHGAADRAGLTVADLEEIALPTFGLDKGGRRRLALGEVTVEIQIEGSEAVALNWTGADGKPRKSVPASVKADHADDLKSLRAEVKEIKGLLLGQRWRLESLYLNPRTWPLADWRKRYLEHPLMANLARRLIWSFNGVPAIRAADAFVDADGNAIDPAADAVVSLWHPIDVSAEDVLAWRRRLAALDIVQPFKQAHREVYLLTDAERATGIYSNRFAAHILRQHQLNALCQARGWRYALQGAWDQEQSVPTRFLSDRRECAEFWVDYASDDYLESGVYLYRTTDQVRFLDETGEPRRLEDVPPLVFSEIMRDGDLFVGVASVGNNPEWQDGGPEGRFHDYWWGYSFGELGETAKTRRDVLDTLLPKLKIAGQCELKDRFLIVRGTKRTYKVHLGSGNILMAPNDEYLCIVPDQSKSAGGDKVRLPFEGDRTFALILSKAFLLAADDKITDRTILSQIGK